MHTDLQQEKLEQKRWRLFPRFNHLNWFDQLIENEFKSPDQIHHEQVQSLQDLIFYASESVPYYKTLFTKADISDEDILTIENLSLLPILSREVLQSNAANIHTTELPDQYSISGTTKTSGSTGQPVEVIHTKNSMLMFSLLKQREFRWFRYNPDLTLGVIRSYSDLPLNSNNKKAVNEETVTQQHWPVVGNHFMTGPCVGSAINNKLEWQLDWLEEQSPDYLLSLSANLENLALGYSHREKPLGSIQGIQAISQTLTPHMRTIVENSFNTIVNENYGLNEIGIVASRCPEGGRFHVHPENCIVEIVDNNGLPVKAGDTGRIIVTTLTNLAMPLIRYDTGDLAEALDGPCCCGRTLPSFGTIQGRYRRIACLPPGTWPYWAAIHNTILHMPAELIQSLQQYQLHQFKDNRFELKIATNKPIHNNFENEILNVWHNVEKTTAPRLTVTQVQKISHDPKTKFENFTSDFMPKPDVK